MCLDFSQECHLYTPNTSNFELQTDFLRPESDAGLFVKLIYMMPCLVKIVVNKAAE